MPATRAKNSAVADLRRTAVGRRSRFDIHHRSIIAVNHLNVLA